MDAFATLLNHWSPRRSEPAAVATIVRTSGSTYRKAGARMLVSRDGSYAGVLSGGCLEQDIRQRAQSVLRNGTPLLASYDTRRIVGCHGSIDVLIEAVEPDNKNSVLRTLETVKERRCPAVAATIFERSERFPGVMGTQVVSEQDLRTAQPAPFPVTAFDFENTLLAGSAVERRLIAASETAAALVQGILPPLRLLIIGGGPDVPPLARLAADLGWEPVVVIDPSQEPADDLPQIKVVAARSDELPLSGDGCTAAVVMTHHFGRDCSWISRLWPLPLRYLGMIGSRRRRSEVLGVLLDSGVITDPCAMRPLHCPAGLDIGADGPREVALSIIAEIKSVISGRSGGFLKDRAGPVHGDPVAA